MTKYSKEVLNTFDTLTRAPWWEEVGSDYRFRIGEPWRREVSSPSGTEGIVRRDGQIGNGIARPDATYFRDTRWQPPVKPLKVGDLIETEEQAESLPVGTIAVTRSNEAIRKVGVGAWKRVGGVIGPFSDRYMAGYGDRIIYLPRSYYAE